MKINIESSMGRVNCIFSDIDCVSMGLPTLFESDIINGKFN